MRFDLKKRYQFLFYIPVILYLCFTSFCAVRMGEDVLFSICIIVLMGLPLSALYTLLYEVFVFSIKEDSVKYQLMEHYKYNVIELEKSSKKKGRIVIHIKGVPKGIIVDTYSYEEPDLLREKLKKLVNR